LIFKFTKENVENYNFDNDIDLTKINYEDMSIVDFRKNIIEVFCKERK